MPEQLEVRSVRIDGEFTIPEASLYAGQFVVGTGFGFMENGEVMRVFLYAFEDPAEPTIQFAQGPGDALQLAAAILEQAKSAGFIHSYQINTTGDTGATS